MLTAFSTHTHSPKVPIDQTYFSVTSSPIDPRVPLFTTEVVRFVDKKGREATMRLDL
jgi:hypothetical protein